MNANIRILWWSNGNSIKKCPPLFSYSDIFPAILSHFSTQLRKTRPGGLVFSQIVIKFYPYLKIGLSKSHSKLFTLVSLVKKHYNSTFQSKFSDRNICSYFRLEFNFANTFGNSKQTITQSMKKKCFIFHAWPKKINSWILQLIT